MISTPVVFFPGTQCDERLWFYLWKQMDIQDRRYTPLQWAETYEQMQGLTEHAIAGDNVHLVGFSMGGYIASQFAIDNPDLVASLTLVGYSPKGLSEAEITARHQMIAALEKGQFKPMTDTRLAQMVWMQGQHAEQAASIVRDMENDLGGSVLKYHMQAASIRPDLTKALANSGVKVNMVAAEYDQIANADILKQVSNEISHASFNLITKSGHLMPLEQTSQLATLLTSLLE